jgi:L-tyrosine C(3)-methyltransferase
MVAVSHPLQEANDMDAGTALERLKSLWFSAPVQARDDLLEEVVFQEELDRFWLVLGGHIYFQTLSAASRLDLFTLLERQPGLTRSQIAKQLGVAEKPIRILLLGCTFLGLVQKVEGGYVNSRVAKLFLTEKSPKNIISFIELEHHIIYKPMHAFFDAIKANKNVGLHEYKGDEPTLYQRLAHYPELEKIFQDAMEDISIQANASFAQSVDLSHVRHLVDVGGGNGANIIQLARKHPTLRATVFDSPTVCQIARENIPAAGLADRLDAVPGNCFTDPFPKGADCFLFCHFFTIWTEEKDRALFKKAYEALPSGGTVMIFNMMQSDDEDGPWAAAMGSPYFLTVATGEGMLYTWKEYETWMRESGFTNVQRQSLPREHGVIRGTKP